ncbi:MAG: 50S ribosomal protein L25/general stress protein Ctc [Pseudohongiellaceae bacterium]
MSNAYELDAKVRADQGKGASRRLRRLNKEIPAILYGGNKDPLCLSIPHKEITKAVENEAFFSHIITLNIGKQQEQAIIKDLQRHPAKPFILHADFQRVSADEEIHVNVPIHFVNEEKCVGVKTGGGSIIKTLTELEIVCLPKDLPEYLEVDMLGVDLNESVHISDIALPEGVTSVALSHGGEDDDYAVASVIMPRAEKEEEPAEEEPGEGEVPTTKAAKDEEESGDEE